MPDRDVKTIGDLIYYQYANPCEIVHDTSHRARIIARREFWWNIIDAACSIKSRKGCHMAEGITFNAESITGPDRTVGV